MTILHTSHARYDLWYHLAWAAKYRKKVFIQTNTKERVKEILRAIALQYSMTPGVVECFPDHVHLTISAPPRIAPAQVAQILKSISTRMLLREFTWLRKQHYPSCRLLTNSFTPPALELDN